MSSAVKKLPLARAQQLAAAVRDELAPGCVRIEVAGSVRRRAPEVGDIELVIIPKRHGLLEDSLLDPILDRLVAALRLHRIKSGAKQKQFAILKADCKLDLFLCEPDNWGMQLAVYTGPENWSRGLVTQWRKGGKLPNNLVVKDGFRIWDGYRHLPTPEEADVFKLLDIPWREPWERS